MMYGKCGARLGVPGAWPCVRASGHTGAHVERGGLASFTEWDGMSYDARPREWDGCTAVPGPTFSAALKRAEKAEAALAAERDEASALLWNLGGCEVYALGHAIDIDPDASMARPALLAVRKTAQALTAEREKVRVLRALLERAVKYAHEDNMNTKGATRLARLIVEAADALDATAGEP